MWSKGKRAEEYRWLLDDVVLCQAIIRSVHIPIDEHLSLSLSGSPSFFFSVLTCVRFLSCLVERARARGEKARRVVTEQQRCPNISHRMIITTIPRIKYQSGKRYFLFILNFFFFFFFFVCVFAFSCRAVREDIGGSPIFILSTNYSHLPFALFLIWSLSLMMWRSQMRSCNTHLSAR